MPLANWGRVTVWCMNANLIAAVTADGTGANVQGRGKGHPPTVCRSKKKKAPIITRLIAWGRPVSSLPSLPLTGSAAWPRPPPPPCAVGWPVCCPIEPSAPPRIVFGSPIHGAASWSVTAGATCIACEDWMQWLLKMRGFKIGVPCFSELDRVWLQLPIEICSAKLILF